MDSSDDEKSNVPRPWDRFWRSDDPVKKRKIMIPQNPSTWSVQDTVAYRRGYPGKKDNPALKYNLKFYQNNIPSARKGDYIDNIHELWWGNYNHLEWDHSYIGWLFPIREKGLNMHAHELQLHEAKEICKDKVAHGRVLKSYKMMLDFYGMRLKDDKTGEVERADNWKERFSHLNHYTRNHLRITRILKCLGEMEYEHLKSPFIQFVLNEIIVEQTLYNCLQSCIDYWLQVIRDDKERETLLNSAEELAKTTQPEKKEAKKILPPGNDTQPEIDAQIKKATKSTQA
ncbi:opioid growth factor receptor-like protein 1 isoform X2 [Dysidea avara]